MTYASETRLAHITEVTYGTTPATPVFIVARFVSEGLSPNIETIASNEITPSRDVSDIIQVGSSAGGAVNFELSYGSFDDFLESALFGTWTSNVLKNDSIQKSFTIEKTFENGTTDQFHRFQGSIANSFSLSMETRKIVTGSFDFLSRSSTSAQAIITGATYTAANTFDIINAASNFASLTIESVTAPELTSLELNVTNNLSQEDILGSVTARGVTVGQFNVTGKMTLYFENSTLYDLFLAGTESGISFRLGGASTRNYVFLIAKLKFNSVDVVAGGNNEPVLANVEFTGLYDTTEDCTLKITRTP